MQPTQTSDIVDVVGLTPIPSPIPSSPLPASEEGRIRCVCGSEEDDGFTIQCDNCLVWQHAGCVGIARSNVPETYLCEECRPEVDVEAPPRARRGRPSRDSLSLLASPVPTVNDISENIVSGEAMGELVALLEGMGEARKRMPRLPRDASLGQVNFELCPSTVVFPSRDALEASGKMLEVRELRARSLVGRKNSMNVARMGVFAAEEIDPGAYIGEYFGQIQPVGVLKKMNRVEPVSQSHVLFSTATPRLIVDARKFGGMLRYVRRSCRANCQVKLLLIDDGEESLGPASRVHWCLFARNTIRPGEELSLPFDYSDGNRYFSYECCCSYPELCLADDMADPIGGGKESGAAPGRKYFAKPTQRAGDSPLSGGRGLARSSSPIPNPAGPPMPVPLVSARKEAMAEKKMSREERKLQQYIEFIERMESAERKQHSRRTGSSSHSGGANSPPPGHSSSEQVSGSPTKRRRKASTPIPSRQSLPNKTSTMSEGESGIPRGPSLNPPVVFDTGSPSNKSTAMPLKKFLSKVLAGKSFEVPSSPGKPDPYVVAKNDPYAGNASIEEVDVVGLTSPPPTTMKVDSKPSHPSDSPTPAKGASESTAITSAPETPSKKRVSLSDYLSRRKSSPFGETPISRSGASPTPLPLGKESRAPSEEPRVIEELALIEPMPRSFNSPNLAGDEMRDRTLSSPPSSLLELGHKFPYHLPGPSHRQHSGHPYAMPLAYRQNSEPRLDYPHHQHHDSYGRDRWNQSQQPQHYPHYHHRSSSGDLGQRRHGWEQGRGPSSGDNSRYPDYERERGRDREKDCDRDREKDRDRERDRDRNHDRDKRYRDPYRDGHRHDRDESRSSNYYGNSRSTSKSPPPR